MVKPLVNERRGRRTQGIVGRLETTAGYLSVTASSSRTRAILLAQEPGEQAVVADAVQALAARGVDYYVAAHVGLAVDQEACASPG
jgi:hypothetical protein